MADDKVFQRQMMPHHPQRDQKLQQFETPLDIVKILVVYLCHQFLQYFILYQL